MLIRIYILAIILIIKISNEDVKHDYLNKEGDLDLCRDNYLIGVHSKTKHI